MLAFYSLELVSFFSSPTAPLIPTSIISPQASGRAQLWSIRAWALYTIIQVGLLVQRSRALSVEENTLKATLYSGEKDAEEVKVQLRDVRKRKAASRLALIENSAFLPLTFHWCVVFQIVELSLHGPLTTNIFLRSLVPGQVFWWSYLEPCRFSCRACHKCECSLAFLFHSLSWTASRSLLPSLVSRLAGITSDLSWRSTLCVVASSRYLASPEIALLYHYFLEWQFFLHELDHRFEACGRSSSS